MISTKFCRELFCCGHVITYSGHIHPCCSGMLPFSGQNNSPYADVMLKYMGNIGRYLITTKHHTARTRSIIVGMWCTCNCKICRHYIISFLVNWNNTLSLPVWTSLCFHVYIPWSRVLPQASFWLDWCVCRSMQCGHGLPGKRKMLL